MEKCDGIKGGNVCGRVPEFEIVTIEGDVYLSCVECIGRIMYEHDLDRAEVFKTWNQ